MTCLFSRVLTALIASVLMAACVSTAPTLPASHVHVGTAAFVLNEARPTRLGAVQYTATHRTNAMTDLVTAIGSAPGSIMILTGAQPASVATVDTGTVLVVLPLSTTAGTVTTGVLTFNAITGAAASASGTAAHFLICTTAVTANCVAATSTTRIIQGSVGTTGSDLNFAGGVAFTSGETINISSFTITANGA